ncbi:kunitz type trypsin inhibitor 106-like [Cicer arietinum]|uniref:Alpha-amylase/subtilisin inhibitor-like n=1 Tax=Cicer arietinum TaxID=3827 RepID=A0A1S2XGF0_CICAR|nr:alpha-amylase/subtilisin inhibitor-like [Cicer arietinum]
MSTRVAKITSLILVSWLFMAITILAQSENVKVLDTKGHPIERGKEYYIKPAITDSGGRFTLINRNGSCPLYVGQENTDLGKGLPVIFTPFAKEDKVVRVDRDFKVKFSAFSTCVQSTEWKLGDRDTKSGRRVIVTGSSGSYFRIVKTQFEGIYNIRFCPTDVCSFCKYDCGTIGGLRENGKILLALDGNVLPLVFERV